MSPIPSRSHYLAVLLSAALLAPTASAHFDDKEIPQSYRQSWFALVAANFGPMVSTVKGEMPWSDESMSRWSHDLKALSGLNLMRGFAAGSEGGTTRAKPEIWLEEEEFAARLSDYRSAVDKLDAAVTSGDREAIAAEVGATGKTCKACHDDYKSENYLN